MDTTLARLEPVPAKFRSLGAARIPDVSERMTQAGQLIMEFINGGGLDDPKYANAISIFRAALDGFPPRMGNNDWGLVWIQARQLLLTPEQQKAWQDDQEDPASPVERCIEHFNNHCNLIADLMDEQIQRIREDDKLSPTHGVSLLDAALILTDEDQELAPQTVKRWHKVRRHRRPPPIGNCPQHSQRQLFVPSALCDWVEKIEGKGICAEHKLRQRLARKARPPRQE